MLLFYSVYIDASSSSFFGSCDKLFSSNFTQKRPFWARFWLKLKAILRHSRNMYWYFISNPSRGLMRTPLNTGPSVYSHPLMEDLVKYETRSVHTGVVPVAQCCRIKCHVVFAAIRPRWPFRHNRVLASS